MPPARPTTARVLRPRTVLALASVLLAALALVLWLGGGGAAPAPQPTTRTEPTPPEPIVATGTAQAASADGRREPQAQRSELGLAEAAPDLPQGVAGRVVDTADGPVGGARVFLVESLQNDPLARIRNVPVPPVAAATTDGGGAFRLGLREPSDRTYDVHVVTPGFANERITGVRVAAGSWHDLGVVRLAAGTTIRGRVTIAGTALPVPQAVITLERGDPLSDVGARDLPGFHGTHVATTDATGTYELPNAPRAGLFRLVAVAPGFARSIRDGIELKDARPVDVNFELLPGLPLDGQVLDAAGQAVAGARIEAWPAGPEPPHVATTQGDGRFALHGLVAGPHRLRVTALGFRTAERAGVEAGSTFVTIALEPRAAARLVVRAPDGGLLRQYRLAVRRWFEGDQIGAVRDVPDRTVRLRPDEQEVVVDGLEPTGSYAFQIEADGFARTLSRPFDFDHGPVLVETVMTRGGELVGRVVDQTGQPVAGATVRTQPDGAAPDNPMWRLVASLAPERITTTSTTTAADGTFRLDGLAHAAYQLQVEHPEYCQAVRKGLIVDADAEREVEPLLLLRGTLVRGRAFVDGVARGQVHVFLTPTPMARGDALVKSRDESPPLRVEAVAGPDGSFVMPRRVPPGVYELSGQLRIGSDPQVDIFHQLQQMRRSAVTVTVPPGRDVLDQDVRITTEH